MKTIQQPWEKYGLSELAYNLAWSQGFRDSEGRVGKKSCTYNKGSNLRKVYEKGFRDAKFKF
jgi:hypothetical protein